MTSFLPDRNVTHNVTSIVGHLFNRRNRPNHKIFTC